MYCFISARSTKAKSIAPVTFDVVRMSTLGYLYKYVSRCNTTKLKTQYRNDILLIQGSIGTNVSTHHSIKMKLTLI